MSTNRSADAGRDVWPSSQSNIPTVEQFTAAWRELTDERDALRTLVIHAIGAVEPTCVGEPLEYLRGDWLQRAYARTGVRPAVASR